MKAIDFAYEATKEKAEARARSLKYQGYSNVHIKPSQMADGTEEFIVYFTRTITMYAD